MSPNSMGSVFARSQLSVQRPLSPTIVTLYVVPVGLILFPAFGTSSKVTGSPLASTSRPADTETVLVVGYTTYCIVEVTVSSTTTVCDSVAYNVPVTFVPSGYLITA